MTVTAYDLGSERKRALAQLVAQHKGTLTPSAVLDSARNLSSPLHDLFTWDDGLAAENFRLIEAASLIRRYRVYVTREPERLDSVRVHILPPLDRDERTITTRGLVSLSSERGDGVYRDLREVLVDPGLREQYEADAAAEARMFRRKWAAARNLVAVHAAIDALPG